MYSQIWKKCSEFLEDFSKALLLKPLEM